MTSLPIGPLVASEDSPFYQLLDRYGQNPECESTIRATVLAAVDMAGKHNRSQYMREFLDSLIERVSGDWLTPEEAAHQLLQSARVWTAEPIQLTV